MTDATLMPEGAQPAIRLERVLADPPAVVWRALTERDQLRSWFPSDVVVDGGEWVVGAALTFRFPPEVIDTTLTGEVLTVDEPHTLGSPGERRRCASSSHRRTAAHDWC
jgi:uncharacterized protein YndB with AHSA1/START domain